MAALAQTGLEPEALLYDAFATLGIAGKILAGIVVALTAQLLLNLLGVGIGLATVDPSAASNPDPKTFSIGAGVWWAVSSDLKRCCGKERARHNAC